MGFRRSISGQVQTELTCADIPRALSYIRSSGLTVFDVQFVDDLCIRLTVSRSDCKKLERIADQKGWQLRQLHRFGLSWMISGLVRRPVLVLGVGFLVLLSLFLPGRILFVQVEGNHAVPTNLIVEAAAKHGVCLGASSREIRSERIKNALLEDVPQLQWLGVNTKGCVAVISVRERQLPEEGETLAPVTSIVSKADGIIQSVTVTQGTAMCKPGDAVSAGQTLISGYSDLGICLRGTRAQGEVYALTQHQITALSPVQYKLRGDLERREVKYALLIGNKRINFYKSSGILDTSCARIYSVWYVTLPGGFAFPLGILRECWLSYDTAPGDAVDPDLTAAAQRYLLQQLTDGQILAQNSDIQQDEMVLTFRGRYACREMVGMIRPEENLNDYGKDSGKNHQR